MPAGAAGNVAILVYDGVGMFELGVACDVFGTNDLADLGLPWYRLFICGAGGAPVTTDGGLRIHPPFGLERTRRVETVVVPPTDRLDAVPTEVFDALRPRMHEDAASSRSARARSSWPKPACSKVDEPRRTGRSVTILPVPTRMCESIRTCSTSTRATF